MPTAGDVSQTPEATPNVIPGSSREHGSSFAICSALDHNHLIAVHGSDRAQTVGSYEPSAKVKKLSTVEQRAGQDARCSCARCPRAVTSNWYFVNPVSKRVSIIVPRTRGCFNPFDRQENRCWFQAPVASPFKCVPDTPGALTFCAHGKNPHLCVPCGGRATCIHGKRRVQCRDCFHLAKRRPKRFAKTCGTR